MLRGSLPLRPRWRALRAPAALVAALAVAGCHYAGSPFDGFGGFIGDTHTFNRNPNLPPGSDENMMQAEGRPVSVPPLLTEPGNVWPGPPPPEPTLSDVLKQQNQEQEQLERGQSPTPPPPSGTSPRRQPQGSSTPPPPPPSVNVPGAPAPSPAPNPVPQVTPPAPAIPSAKGPLIPSGPNTVTAPGGGTSIVVPNGNGTSTVINPDGTTQTIITPKP